MKPERRSVSICTKMSGVSGPCVRKPNPRNRLNHFTTTLSQSLSGGDDDMGALGQLRRRDCGGVVHAADADGLETLGTPYDFADHACAFAGSLEAAASKAGHMQENVGKALIRCDKPVAL